MAVAVLGAGCDAPRIAPVEQGRWTAASASLCTPPREAVDVLIVVDDSASMAEEQEHLAINLQNIAFIYDEASSRLDYRIAVVPASASHPACKDFEPPNDGVFASSSCLSRLDDFVSPHSPEGFAFDARDTCRKICDLETLPMRNPWIERIDGVSNLPDGLGPWDVLPCMGLPGIAGCRFQSPLEAMFQALRRVEDPSDPAFGFLRRDAALFVLFISDGMDCSVRDGRTGPFSDPSVDLSACWEYAMECDADRNCWPVDRALDGSRTDADDSVLWPAATYIDFLQGIDELKLRIDPAAGRKVFVSAVGGKPIEAGLMFPEPADEDEAQTFGVGRACTSDLGSAHPSPRLFEVARTLREGFQPEQWSVCAADFSPALACVPEAWGPPPTCIACAADMSNTRPGLQPECTAWEALDDGSTRPLPACAADGLPPEGAQRCYSILSGQFLSDSCRVSGTNAQLQVVRLDQRPAGCVHVECLASPDPTTDCPAT